MTDTTRPPIELNWCEPSALDDRSGTLIGWNPDEGYQLLIWQSGKGYMHKDTKLHFDVSMVANIPPIPFEFRHSRKEKGQL